MFANFENFLWIRKNKHSKYVSYLKIGKNKYTPFFCRSGILNEKTKFRFKLFLYRIFIAIYKFSLLLSWFSFSVELSDQRNISQKNETCTITAFPIEI